MKLLLVFTIALAFIVYGEKFDNDEESPEVEDALDNELLEDDDFESLGDPNTIEAMEELRVSEQSDPFVLKAIGYYCKLCKACDACKKVGKCKKGAFRTACSGCKYCNLKTYLNMARRLRRSRG